MKARRSGRPVSATRRIGQVLIVVASCAFLCLFLVVPLASVFVEALRQGAQAFVTSLDQPEAMAAIRLTLLVAAITVPLNVIFGVAAAWAMTRFTFRGNALLGALIDLPLSVSPVVSGLLYVLMFGAQGWFGPWLSAHGIKVIFAVPGWCSRPSSSRSRSSRGNSFHSCRRREARKKRSPACSVRAGCKPSSA